VINARIASADNPDFGKKPTTGLAAIKSV